MRLVDWIMKMNSDSLRSEPKSDIRDFLERRANLLTVGINLAVQIKRTVKSLIMSHELTRTSLSPERLKDILQAVEMLKAIEIEFKTKKFIINQWVVLMNRNIADKINEILKYVPGIVQTKKLKDPLNLWLTYLAQTITKSLNGGFNLLRKTVVNHCKCLIFDNIFEKE
jgi:WASH complex subunit 7, N-terminal